MNEGSVEFRPSCLEDCPVQQLLDARLQYWLLASDELATVQFDLLNGKAEQKLIEQGVTNEAERREIINGRLKDTEEKIKKAEYMLAQFGNESKTFALECDGVGKGQIVKAGVQYPVSVCTAETVYLTAKDDFTIPVFVERHEIPPKSLLRKLSQSLLGRKSL